MQRLFLPQRGYSRDVRADPFVLNGTVVLTLRRQVAFHEFFPWPGFQVRERPNVIDEAHERIGEDRRKLSVLDEYTADGGTARRLGFARDGVVKGLCCA